MKENNDGNNTTNTNNQGNNLGTINTDFLNNIPDTPASNTNFNQETIIKPNPVNNFAVPTNSTPNNTVPPTEDNNKQVSSDTENKSNLKSIILIIIVFILIVICLAFCYLKFIKFSPKGIFINGINNIFKETNNKINDLPEMSTKNKFNGSISINSDNETLSKYNNYKLVYNGEIDYDNHNYKIALGLNDDTHSDSDAELTYVNNKYYLTLNKEYYDKTITYEADDDTSSSINDYLNNSISIRNTSSLKDANNILKNTIIDNINNLKYSIGIESINNKNYNYSETLIDRNKYKDLLDNIDKSLSNNSNFNDSLKNALGLDYSKLKEQFNKITNNDYNNNDYNNDDFEYTIKIYYSNDIIPVTKGLCISDNTTNNKILFILDNKDIYSEISINSEKILITGNTSNIKITNNDKEYATLKINSFKVNNIDFEYEINNDNNINSDNILSSYTDGKSSGKIKLVTNNKNITFSLSTSYKDENDKDSNLTINGDFIYDDINSVSVNEDNIIDYNSLTDEDFNNILSNINSSSRPVAQVLSDIIDFFLPSADATYNEIYDDNCAFDETGAYVCQ